jgi:hypothetical protein
MGMGWVRLPKARYANDFVVGFDRFDDGGLGSIDFAVGFDRVWGDIRSIWGW